MTIGIAIIGYGKIATDQHIPAIEGEERFRLVATSSRSGHGPPPRFTDYRQLLREVDGLKAVAITTPPGPRGAIAAECIAAGLHVLLEKPPTATLSETDNLARLAEERGVTLFATWHARHNPAVAAAAQTLAGKRVAAMDIVWHEDVRKWHPGQSWIWKPGGFGVFDPGINALSIATAIFPGPLFMKTADLHIPENAQTPIAVEAELISPAADGPLRCSLDWRVQGDEQWTINIKTADGMDIELRGGGSELFVYGQRQAAEGLGEYPAIYARFAELIERGESDVDVAPLRLVADALLVGQTHRVEAVDQA